MTTYEERAERRAIRKQKQEKTALIRRMMLRVLVAFAEMIIVAAAAVLTAGLLLGFVEFAPPKAQHLVIIAVALLPSLYLTEKFFIKK